MSAGNTNGVIQMQGRRNMKKVCRAVAAILFAAAMLGGCNLLETIAASKVEITGDARSFEYKTESGEEINSVEIKNIYFYGTDDAEINVYASEENKVEVVCSEQFFENGLTVKIEDGTLEVSANSSKVYKLEEFQVNIYATPEKIRVMGGYELSVELQNAENTEIRIDGSTDAEISAISCGEIKVELNGAGEIEVEGNAEDFICSLNGAGNIKAAELIGKNVDVSISGAGNAEVYAEQTLKAAVSGAGSIKYGGNPTLEKSISGFGSVQQIISDEK